MENIIAKIQKLLALANSSNEHEAALAASHAQRLLSEHNLAMADIESEQKPQSADKVETKVSKTLPVIFRTHSPTWFSHPFTQARRAELVR